MDTLSKKITKELKMIKDNGLYKNERIIDSKQNAKIIDMTTDDGTLGLKGTVIDALKLIDKLIIKQ